MRKQVDAEMPRETAATFRHHLIVIPPKRGPEDRPEDSHPRFGCRNRPIVAHVGRLAFGYKVPAAEALQVTRGNGLQR
jgi:hypothetical protein